MLRFRLRTLLIAVAVLAVPMTWVGYSLRWIAERRAMIDLHEVKVEMALKAPIQRAPGGLWIFGERGRPFVFVEPGYGEAARALFPEAKVTE